MKRALFLVLALANHCALAGSFGIYDPRSQAMGGAAVAVGSVDMAAGHNPALLGLYNEDEDKSRNGRYFLPYAVGSIAEVAIDALDLLDQELDIVFDNALDVYNNSPSAVNAGAVSAAARDLEEGLTQIANRDITFSAFVPIIAVSEPSKKGGGGFYLGSRIEGGGLSYVPDDDIALFDDYVDALDNVAAGGDWRQVNCHLFNLTPDADGNIICSNYPLDPPPALNDPFDEIDSNARIRGLVINEVAVAAAWGFDLDRMRVAVGFTPKIMQVRVFDEFREVSDDDIATSQTFKPHLMMNTDIGIAIDFDIGVRLAYVGKDLITRQFSSDNGKPIQLDTKHRVGLGYIRPNWQIGMDYDMQANQPYTTEKTGQFLSLGAEYVLFNRLALRAGYRYDTDNNLAATTSFGVGAQWLRTTVNLSYESSQDEQGAGLQLGFSF